MNSEATGVNATAILLVVKDTERRKQLGKDLDSLGYAMVEAPSAESAIKYLKDNTPDLIVMDVDLPGVSGIQACRKIRTANRLALTPVILLVEHEDVTLISKAYEAGATDCIVNSSTSGVVSIRIRYALRNAHQTMDLSRKQEQLDQAQQVAKLGYWRLDVVTQSLTLSDFALQLLQTERGSRLTNLSDYLSHVHVADREEVKLGLERALYDRQSFSIDHRVIASGGREVYLHIQGEVIYDQEERPVSMFGTMQDITTRKRNEVTNEHMALYDGLTDLCNRRLFQSRLSYLMNTTLRDEKLLALCFFDLDKFKAINDNLGHAFGDELLKAVAKRLRGTMRQGDLIARISGDEFALAIEGLSTVDELEKILEKLLGQLASPYSIRGHTLLASASVGVALYPMDSASRDTMMRYADAAMYKAKESGGNCYRYYTHDMNDKSRRRLELETKLRHAVADNQIRVYYQPQVNINTGAVLGFEALVRWDHPEYGILPPVKFLSIAEDTGIILPIGDWLILAACKQIVLWEKSGLGCFRLAVNLSARQLMQSELVNKIGAALRETQLPAERLCIEVKESAAMKESAATLKTLNELKSLGVCLAVDDFGVGHSSMNQLQNLPIDAITIDRSFVMNIAGRERDGIGAKAIIGLAKNLGLHVTAEGVETKTQVEFLRRYQCEEAQGNYYSPPIPAHQVPNFIASMSDVLRATSEPI